MKRYVFAIGLLSVALIAYQLVLMQILGYVQWYHFAYMVISVAMLGFGASGTVISLFREWLLRNFEWCFSGSMLLSGMTMATVITGAQAAFGGFDSYLLFVDRSQIWSLVATYLLYFLPFFFGALSLGLAFVRHVEQIGTLYFSNLLGSGLGGLAAIALMWLVPLQSLPATVAILPVISGILVYPTRHLARWTPAAAVAVAVVGISLLFPPTLDISEFKSLSRTLNLPDAQIEYEANSPHGLLHLVSSPALRHAPGLSLAYAGEIPVRQAVFNSGEWLGAAVEWTRADTSHLHDYTTEALPYHIRNVSRVMVLNAGTGAQVSHALTRGATSVTAVEPHPAVVHLLRSDLAEITDSLYLRPDVRIDRREPRTFLATTDESFDLIISPTIGAFGGTAGIYALQEQYSLTREAFYLMWQRLSSRGMMSFTVWMDYPVRNPLKTLASLLELLESQNIDDPRNHLAAIRSWGAITFVVSRSAFASEEVSRIRSVSRQLLFDPLILPDLSPGERDRYNQLDDEQLFVLTDRLLASEREALYASYDFHLRPATDNRPYFSQFLRWASLPHLADLFGDQAVPFLEVGYLVVLFTFFQIVLLAFILIVLPLFRVGWKGRGKSWTLVYFSALGFGFMFVEMVFIHQFILYFGQPIYAAAAVLSALLICSGAGSYVSSRLAPDRHVLRTVTGSVGAMILIYTAVLPLVLQATIGFPGYAKAFVSLLLLAPPAFLMGIPFPLGLRHTSRLGPTHVPWAWAVNGSISVVSAALATVVAVQFGFVAVMICAAAAYGLAALINLTRVVPTATTG